MYKLNNLLLTNKINSHEHFFFSSFFCFFL